MWEEANTYTETPQIRVWRVWTCMTSVSLHHQPAPGVLQRELFFHHQPRLFCPSLIVLAFDLDRFSRSFLLLPVSLDHIKVLRSKASGIAPCNKPFPSPPRAAFNLRLIVLANHHSRDRADIVVGESQDGGLGFGGRRGGLLI